MSTPTFFIYRNDFRKVNHFPEGMESLNLNNEKLNDSKLQQVCDIILNQHSAKTHLSPHSTIILPLEGGIQINFEASTKQLHPSEAIILSAGIEFTITNPENTCRYLLIELNLDLETQFHKFSLTTENQLVDVLRVDTIALHLGVFDARVKFELNSAFQHSYSFSINGAFELEDRLLETNDGLSSFNQSTLEGESLSEKAILLIVCY